jgi:hypothetical protein
VEFHLPSENLAGLFGFTFPATDIAALVLKPACVEMTTTTENNG